MARSAGADAARLGLRQIYARCRLEQVVAPKGNAGKAVEDEASLCAGASDSGSGTFAGERITDVSSDSNGSELTIIEGNSFVS